MYLIKDFPSEEKPRERMCKYGNDALSNSELLALILCKGTKNKNVIDLSRELLNNYNLSNLPRQDINNLMNIGGIGLAKACQIVACFEIGRRAISYNGEEQPIIRCAEDVYKLLYPKLKSLKQEHLIGLYLDTRSRVIKIQTLFIGTLDASVIHPREILKSAINLSAASIIIAHNHPSGDPSPSKEDRTITKQIMKAGEIMGIPILDHVIIGDTYASLRKIIS